jgi:prolipoprotein diacylglyceryl transferase
VTTFLASFPSPPRGVVLHLGPFPLRWYALFIIVGIIVALIIGNRRWVARGGQPGVIYDIAVFAVPFGLIGGRLYHVMTDWQNYFGPDGLGFLATLEVWEGGLGIWGAVALGGVGAWIGCRKLGIPLPAFGDAIAPGIVLAQAIGRLGNYFNEELYGRETSLPWGLKIYERRDASGAVDYLNGVSTGHVEKIVQPTFLYELIWNVLVFVLLIYVDRRFKLGHGRLFATYVAAYCVGRFCVELLRDDAATHIAGIRINSFTSVFVFIGAVVYLILAPKGREDPATLVGKPRKPKEKPKAVKKKEEVPQKLKSAEESALVEWTKELAAVAATSGVVAGVAVAAEHDEEDKPSAHGEGEPIEGRADETVEPVEHTEPESAEASAAEAGVTVEPGADVIAEAGGEEAPAEEVERAPAAEAEEAPAAEAEEAPAAEAEEAPAAEAEQAAKGEAEVEVVAEQDKAEPKAEEVSEGEAEGPAEPAGEEAAEAEVEEVAAAEAEAAPAAEVVEEPPAEADDAPAAEAEAIAEPEGEQVAAAEAEELSEGEAQGPAEPAGEEAAEAEVEEAPAAEAEGPADGEAEEEVVAEEDTAEPEAGKTAGAEAEHQVLSGQVTEESTAKLEPDEEAGEEAAEPEEPGSKAEEDVTVGAEGSAGEENGDPGATHSTDDVPEDAGIARRWWVPRLRNRAK